ncbi:hypothetical protein ACQKGO_24780 [Corallococcus interemptor]|uniref:hypothetical protein n=1 Tax=Corallococcus interemptor TaxID=2316720 RepID=UPI003D004239
MAVRFVRGAYAGALLMGLMLGSGCGPDAAMMAPEEEIARAPSIETTEQGLSAPIQDPQACALPSGRYVVLATPTTTANVFNVTFPNNGIAGSSPGSTCQTMKLVWDEGIPFPSLPPQPPATADFPKRLLEGWWQQGNVDKRFAVKAVWATNDNLGVITQISGAAAHTFYVERGDLDVPYGYRFNWAATGSDTNHIQVISPVLLLDVKKVVITDSAANHPYQRLSCLSGTTRLNGSVSYNCPIN